MGNVGGINGPKAADRQTPELLDRIEGDITIMQTGLGRHMTFGDWPPLSQNAPQPNFNAQSGVSVQPSSPQSSILQSEPPNHPHSVRPPLLPSGHLVDPITAKEQNIHHVPVDRILDYSPLDNLAHNLKTLFVILPKTVMKGIRGDSDFTFSDFMLISQIPYYAGGAFLAYSFLAGRDKPGFVRQGIGVLLYYTGIMAANSFINRIYKFRYGVDLNLKYRRADGRIEKVFSSADFSRFDLLTNKQYFEMQQKMGIPSTVADPDQACRDQLYGIVSSSRAIKLVLGNVLAAVGAGYIARSELWARLIGKESTLKQIWTSSHSGGLLSRVANSWEAVRSLISPAVNEKVFGSTLTSGNPWLRKSTMIGLAGIILFSIYESLNVLRPKRYESSPFTLLPRGENWLNDRSIFKQFQVMQDGGRHR